MWVTGGSGATWLDHQKLLAVRMNIEVNHRLSGNVVALEQEAWRGRLEP